jgi:hypothetical protein
VLGGDGWTLRDYYTSGAPSEHLTHAALVKVVTLEAASWLPTSASETGDDPIDAPNQRDRSDTDYEEEQASENFVQRQE